MTNKKGIYLVITGIVAIALGLYLYNRGDTLQDQPAAGAGTAAGTEVLQTPAATAQPSAVEARMPEPASVEIREEKPILGQFMRVNEIYDADGQLRNLRFVFREGILPQMLFPDNRQLIIKYDQLARNMVGFGAATTYFYYEIVTRDTNDDGVFSEQDAITVAVSRPTGWEYQVLERNVQEVLAYEDLPEEEALRLSLRMGGKEVTRVYPLGLKK
ncbi:MAG TPA: hypothetical protein VFX02_05305 [Gammaproteobacteria bacterium]|nr:hypothetical protein [Gammaproteobacteria bacterium]